MAVDDFAKKRAANRIQQWWLDLWEEDIVTATHTGHFLKTKSGEDLVNQYLGDYKHPDEADEDFEAGGIDFSSFSSMDFTSSIEKRKDSAETAAKTAQEEEGADAWAARLEREASEKNSKVSKSAEESEADSYVHRLEEEAKQRAHAEWHAIQLSLAHDMQRRHAANRIGAWWRALWEEDLGDLARIESFIESADGEAAVDSYIGDARNSPKITAIINQNEADLDDSVWISYGGIDIDDILSRDPLKEAMASLQFEETLGFDVDGDGKIGGL